MCLLATLKTRHYIKQFVHKSLAPFSRNSTLNIEDLLYPICKAASHFTYIETIGNKADSLHKKIEQGYEETVFEAYRKLIKQLLGRKRFLPVTIAIDFTKENFYGKTRNLYLNILLSA